MSYLMQHLEREMRLSGLLSGTDDYGDDMVAALREVVGTIDKQEHSGGSIEMLLSLVNLAVEYKPFTPLTGRSDEWVHISDNHNGGNLWQNSRCGTVFKNDDFAYDIDGGPVYEFPDGVRFVKGGEYAVIEFPYRPGSIERPVVLVDVGGEPLPNEVTA